MSWNGSTHKIGSGQYLRRRKFPVRQFGTGNFDLTIRIVRKYARARAKTDKVGHLAAETVGYIAEETSEYTKTVDK